ncbi:uncharacterized protein METZ01_LOCUS14797 [marine metagenome]|uniref:Uncharacterized protein n=1 Tax=marine metagenome TaxID=408172 RepID=A0A381P8I6_9ZZZZ
MVRKAHHEWGGLAYDERVGQGRYDGTSKQSENDVAETMPLPTHQAMRYTVRA